MVKHLFCFIVLGVLCACSDLRNGEIEKLVGTRSNLAIFNYCDDENEISLKDSKKIAYLNETEENLKKVEASYNDFQKFIYQSHLKEGYDRIESCRNHLTKQIKENHKKYLEEKKLQEEQEKRWEKQRKEEFEKYGMNRCDMGSLWMYVARATNPPKGCMVSIEQEIMFFSVMQQIPDGTLVHGSLPGDYSYLPDYGDYTFFIERSKKDMEKTDNQIIAPGLFEYVGNFQYYSIFGAERTVPKFKRLK